MAISSIGGTYGLSGSGMDIDSIITKLMMGQQAKSDALLQKKTVLEWQKAAYNTVYDDLNNFRTTTFNYKLQGTLSPNKVSSSNTSVVTATANAEAADVNHSLVVAQLAGGVNLTSSDSVTTGANKDTITNQFYGGVAPTGSYKFTITNGTES
ncbi:MAG: flagellar cap protein FliD N-terminal domain-containing protein, partial [Desulfosporosinus sp.]